MFDEETEELATELGLEVVFPLRRAAPSDGFEDRNHPARQRGGRAERPERDGSRPPSYRALLDLARGAGLGDDLVVQTPYGDSGQTTFFVANERDWRGSEDDIVGQDLKVMKRIEPRECAIEGVITRHGTLVGPLMTELTGFPELTPYDGGWCGNDVSPDVLTEAQRTPRPRAHEGDGRAAAAGGLPRVLRARLPRWTRTPVSSTWAS